MAARKREAHHDQGGWQEAGQLSSPAACTNRWASQQGQKIPAAKMAAAARGDYGPKAAKQANLATGMLAAGRRTAASNRKGKASGGKAK